MPEDKEKEAVREVMNDGRIRMERIVSLGQVSPPGFWYDQEEHEWIAVLSGKAILQLEEQTEPITMTAGDTFYLPARTKHRVEWTDPLNPTIWLAVFWKS